MAEKALQPTVEKKQTTRPFGIRDKFGYLFGDFGNDFFFQLVMAFLMVFYTDIFHINPAVVGGLFLVARLWDAFADVTWGRFIDTRKSTKNGKYKPWILRMSLPLVVVGVLMFVKIPGMSDGFYLAWAFVTYIVWGTLYSTVNIPYGSMASVMTGDPVERTSLSTWRTAGLMLASLLVNAVAPLIVYVDNTLDANRMLMTATVFGVLALACYFACYKLSTERIVIPETVKGEKSFGKTVKGLVKNKPLIWILVASLVFMTNLMLVATVNAYLFKDYFANTAALSLWGLLNTVVTFIAAPIVTPLVKKYGKKEIASFGLLLASATYYVLYFVDISATAFVYVSAIGLFGSAFLNLVIWAFVTDVIDYHEYLTDLREDATVYSIYSMARKIGQALAGGLGGVAIAAVGYNSTQATQTEAALSGIYGLGTLLPAVLYTAVLLILWFLYPLNKKRTGQLADDLAAKRSVK